MAVALITLDGRRIGIAEHDESGLGVLTWFNVNTSGAYSMAHALEHEGYAVQVADDVDCHDVESIIGAICERAGVTMESTFVPFSQSRNAKPRPGADKPWRSLNWEITIKRHGRHILTTDYAQGAGHTPAAKKTAAQMETAARAMGRPVRTAREMLISDEIEKGRVARGHSAFGFSYGAAIPAPPIGDVMQSLARDSDVLDHAGFESWASNYDYDVDSRSAESVYRACLDTATRLRAGLGERLLSEIRLAAQFN